MILHEDYQYSTSKSWTDDLEVCKLSGIGFSTNQIYREDGNRQQDHEFEDRSFHYKFDQNGYLYGVFDGHEGVRAVHFCSQNIVAEILLEQLHEKSNNEEIMDVLRQAFLSVEKSYMESIDNLIAAKTSLSFDIPDGLNSYEAYQQVPDVVQKIQKINSELSCGTAAAIALIYNNKLYIANVGSCRVLLCKTDQNNVLKVVQLSVDHNLKNEDEILRLSQLGIGIEKLRQSSHLGNQDNTRCLGNYLVKGGYKEFEDLCIATQSPINSEPDIHGGIEIDSSCRFLLLMSSGLFKAVEEAAGTDQVNKFIAQCVVEQFREQATLMGVAQAVVDRVVRLHHDWYMSTSMSNYASKREDITLLVRNFNYPLPNAIKSPNSQIIFNPKNIQDVQSTIGSTSNGSNETGTFTNSSSIHEVQSEGDVDGDHKIDPYVDFSMYYRNLEIAKQNGTLTSDFDFDI